MGESKSPRSTWNDERVERILGTLLQSGVIISGLVVLAGGILYLLHYGSLPVHYENFVAERERLRSLAAIGNDAVHGDGRAVIQCGLLLLIATPLSRVVFSIIGFEFEKDRLYDVLTLNVFLILIYSLFGGAI
jgi:uncharacterized membrane protein